MHVEGIRLNKTDRGILYGLVLGDGNLSIIKGQIKPTAKLTIGHSPRQEAYINYKADLLLSIFGGRRNVVYSYKSFNKQVNKEYTNLAIAKTETYFRQMHRILYPKGVKVYTRKALDYITDAGLALWYMDDGSGTICVKKDGRITSCMTRIATYCPIEEAVIIRDWFKEKYNINTKFDVDKRSNKISIRMNTKDSKSFVDIVKPYIHESMKYKIEHVE